MVRSRRRFGLIVGTVSGVLATALLAPLAWGDSFGQLGAEIGTFGTPSFVAGQLNFPTDLAVDSSDNSAFVLDEEGAQYGVGTANFRIQKFSSGPVVAPAASLTLPVASGETVDGIAVDASLSRLYVLKAVKTTLTQIGEYVGSKIEAYSTNEAGGTLPPASNVTTNGHAGIFYEFNAPPTTTPAEPVPAGTLTAPIGLAVDPSTHDLIVLGEGPSAHTLLQRVETTGPTFATGTVSNSDVFDDSSNLLANSGAVKSVEVGSSGAIYVIGNSVAGEPVGAEPGILKLTGAIAAPTVTTVDKEGGSKTSPELTGGAVSAAGGRDEGPQVAVSSDGGLLYAIETIKAEALTKPKKAGSYAVRGLSTASGAQQVVFGGGAGTTCRIASKTTAVAAGSGGVVYALDEGNSETGGGHAPFGFDLVEFGPGGSGCPQPATSFSFVVNGKTETGPVQKGQGVEFAASEAELKGEKPSKLVWEAEGPEPYKTEVTGSPASLKAGPHKFLKPGLYTVKLQMTVEPGSFGAPPAVTKTIEVIAPPPTASFEVSNASPKPGEEVTFDAGNSLDPTGGVEGAPTHTMKSYTWNFGDGSPEVTTSTPQVTHIYANPGAQPLHDTVTLKVVNEEETQSTPTTQELTIQGTPEKTTPIEPAKEAPKETVKEPVKEVPGVKPPVSKKPLTRAQKLAAALKLCKKDKSKKKRASCEKLARKKYGPVKKKVVKKGH